MNNKINKCYYIKSIKSKAIVRNKGQKCKITNSRKGACSYNSRLMNNSTNVYYFDIKTVGIGMTIPTICATKVGLNFTNSGGHNIQNVLVVMSCIKYL